MITAKMEREEGNDVLLLGLSRENINRLREGKPIHVDGDKLGLDNDILLVYGETESHILDDLQPMIGSETRIESTKTQTVQ